MRYRGRAGALCAALLAAAAGTHGAESAQTWRGLAVAPSTAALRTSAATTPYPQSIETRIVTGMGGRVYGPYTGRHFASRRETDVEHMVATSEAHDSGLCAADAAHEAAIRLRPAEPDAGGARGEPAPEEREGRRGVAAAGKPVLVRGTGRGGQAQAPAHRGRARGESPGGGLVAVRLDRDDGVRRAPPAPSLSPSPEAPGPGEADALRRWDTDGNGRITCREARAHGIAPVRRGHPAWRFMRDGDGDGVVCE